MRLQIAALLLLVSQAFAATPTVLNIADGQVRQPMPGRTVTAGYFTLHNPTTEAVQLTSASSPLFTRVELHQHSHKDGVMRMEQVADIEVAAHSSITLQPGGLHLMLFEPQTELTIGQTVPVLLHFADGQQLEMALPVVAMPKR